VINLKKLKYINNNVDLDEYMEHPEWLGDFIKFIKKNFM
jgi:hypothetical protein